LDQQTTYESGLRSTKQENHLQLKTEALGSLFITKRAKRKKTHGCVKSI